MTEFKVNQKVKWTNAEGSVVEGVIVKCLKRMVQVKLADESTLWIAVSVVLPVEQELPAADPAQESEDDSQPIGGVDEGDIYDDDDDDEDDDYEHDDAEDVLERFKIFVKFHGQPRQLVGLHHGNKPVIMDYATGCVRYVDWNEVGAL